MKIFSLVLSLCLFGVVCASNWQPLLVPVPKDTIHTVTLFVKLREDAAATCDSLLMKISDPDSPMWGKHLSFEDMQKFSDPVGFHRVLSWLYEAGFSWDEVDPAVNMEWIDIRASIAKLEQGFGASFNFYEAGETVILRSKHYSIPETILQHIDSVHHLTDLPRLNYPDPLFITYPSSGTATPAIIKKYYGITSQTVETKDASQAIYAAIGQSFSSSDLHAWDTKWNLPFSGIQQVIGPNDPSSCSSNPNNCVEASLDVQQITTMAQATNTTFWAVPDSISDIFLYWIQQVASNSKPPLVHSISYGSLGPENPKNDMKRFNTEACKLGLRGLTICVASGDDGVANFEARNNPSECGFTPSYPATSPYLTAVGATQGPESDAKEIACSSATGGLITTGGGFSDYFPQPSWQSVAVKHYLANAPNLPPSGQFNAQGRAYPDMAFMGHNFDIVVGGATYEGSGTSASSPNFAGMLTLINGRRMKAGKQPIGFLNQLLYTKVATQHPEVFHDITVGENNCCAGQIGSQTCCQYGFNATSGWDPLTGWGSVKFEAFAKVLVDM
jgi:tripeptidyl-peptidase-1